MTRFTHQRLSRRDVLKSVGAASAAAVASTFAAPMILAQDKTPSKNPIVGEGKFRYECFHDWVQLPDKHQFGGALHGIAVDAAGLIYITHHGSPDSIFVFDDKGKFVKSMGDIHKGQGHGIEIRKEGNEEFLYLAPNNPNMSFAKMTLKGEVVWQRTRADMARETGKYSGNSPFNPTNTSFSPDGGFFLGDGYGSNLIHQYDKEGKYVRTIGGTGNGDGQFRTPHGNWLDDRDGTPKLVVTDRANARLQWFDMEGKHLKTQGGLLFPADVDIQGDVMMVPDLHCRITLLDKDNKVITHLGEDEAWRKQALDGFKMRGQRAQWKPGRFIHPHDAKFTKSGDILVAEWVVTGRVSLLKKVT